MLKLAGEFIEEQLADHIVTLDAHTKNYMEILRTGEYIYPSFRSITTSKQTIANDRMYATLWIVTRDISIDRLAIECDTTPEADADARLGIYNDGTNLYPGTLLRDGGAVDLDTTGIKTVTFDPVLSVPKGIYWLAVLLNSPGNAGKLKYGITGSPSFSVNATNFGAPYTAWDVAQAYGALPDPFTAGAALNSSRAFLVLPRIASLD